MINHMIKSIMYSFLFACTFLLDLHAGAGIGVQDMFSQMSEQELIAQVQKGDELMRYMETEATPEERAEFEAEMIKMFNQLSPEDLAEIEAIAEAVAPHIESSEPPKKKVKTDDKPVKKKDRSKITTDDSIRSLLLTINKIIDTVMLKVASDPLLTDFFSSNSMKPSIALFQRLVSLLSNKQNVKRLSDKKNKESEKLVEKLKEFKGKLEEKNNKFQVEDSFGLKAKDKKSDKKASRKSYNANITKLESIVEEFNNGLQDLMPEMEKFIRQYEKDDQEMAKLYQDLKEASQKHAKEYQKKRGSTPSKEVRSNSKSQSPGNKGYGGSGSGYDPYSDYYSPRSKDGKREKPKQKPKNGGRKPPQGGGYRDRDKDKDKRDDSKKPFDQVTEEIDEYIDAYDEKDSKRVSSTYKEIAARPAYESAKEKYDRDHAAWIANGSAGSAPTKPGLAEYSDNIGQFQQEEVVRMNNDANKLGPVTQNFSDLESALTNSQKVVRSLNAQELKNLQAYKPYEEIVKRSDEYADILVPFTKSEKAQNDLNLEKIRVDLKEMKKIVDSKGNNITQTELDDFETSKQSALDLQGNYQQQMNETAKRYSALTSPRNVLERTIKSARRKFERSASGQRKGPGAQGRQN